MVGGRRARSIPALTRTWSSSRRTRTTSAANAPGSCPNSSSTTWISRITFNSAPAKVSQKTGQGCHRTCVLSEVVALQFDS